MTGSYPRRKGIYIMRDKNLLHIQLVLIYLGMRPCNRRFLGFSHSILIVSTLLSFNSGSVHYPVNAFKGLLVGLGGKSAAKLLLVNISVYPFSSPGLCLGRLLRPKDKLFNLEYGG